MYLSETSINIPCRISYANIWEPKAPKGSTEARYSCQLLVDLKDTALLQAIGRAIKAAEIEGADKLKGKPLEKQRRPIVDPSKDLQLSSRPEYQGVIIINANNKKQPDIVRFANGRNGKVVPITDEAEVYSGCYCVVAVNFFAYNNVGVGIGCSLQHILFRKDGERLDGRLSAEATFSNTISFDDDAPLSGGNDAAALLGL